MTYQSVDKLQKLLADEVFVHTKDPKKAAGRALGTLVEVITYYLLKTWGLNDQISIERGLIEYGNALIAHNVEYSLHPIFNQYCLILDKKDQPITANKILKQLSLKGVDLSSFTLKNSTLLGSNILRNACTIAISDDAYLLCSIKSDLNNQIELQIYEQSKKLYAMFECKRVGVEEGMTKGLQTIEKAKQGAYVARTASSLQRIRSEDGVLHGIIYRSDGSFLVKPYHALLEDIVNSSDAQLLRKFVLTVGIVSNHGNWIKKDHNGELQFSEAYFQKELLVLAQSYDWLLFLTDKGLSDFIDGLLLNPPAKYKLLQSTFLSSYAEGKRKNQFTKVQMNLEADRLLLQYFKENLDVIETWFNVVSPSDKNLHTLQKELDTLRSKNWRVVLDECR